MSHTAHSEIGEIQSLFLKKVEDGFVSQDYLDENWESYRFLEKPYFNRAVIEYRAFEKIFIDRGIDIQYFPQNDLSGMDSIYVRDASIMTDYGVIICRMGKEGRSGEPKAALSFYRQLNIPVLGFIKEPGTLEGGDVAWIDQQTIAVGRSYRTNDSGIAQLRSFLEPMGYRVIVVDLPHYKGQEDVFHLMSIFSPVDKKMAVVYSPLMPIRFRELLIEHGYDLLEVPDHEFETMGCNVLALSPEDCLILEGNPITQSLLEEKGKTAISYKGHHISYLGGGGPTCLTRPYFRSL